MSTFYVQQYKNKAINIVVFPGARLFLPNETTSSPNPPILYTSKSVIPEQFFYLRFDAKRAIVE